MKPHKHAELIKAWADGAEIESKRNDGTWVIVEPAWSEQCEYRIKPELKPDVVNFYHANPYLHGVKIFYEPAYPNIKLTFDGETGELKSAEVLK